MRSVFCSSLVALCIAAAPVGVASAQDAPQFMKDTWPSQGVEAAWRGFQAVMGDDTALDSKTKELIALAVSAQIPCEYCVHYHTKAAEQHGANEDEIKEALASAALVRKWSTMLNGSQYDSEEWRAQVDAMFSAR